MRLMGAASVVDAVEGVRIYRERASGYGQRNFGGSPRNPMEGWRVDASTVLELEGTLGTVSLHVGSSAVTVDMTLLVRLFAPTPGGHAGYQGS